MKPLRVTFYPLTPVLVPDRPQHLDALLGAAIYHGAERAEVLEAKELSENLPLEKAVGSDGEWCWKASRLEYERAGGIFSIHHVRRFEIGRWARDRERGYWYGRTDAISNGSGEMKAYTFTEQTMLATRVTAWCVGDAEQIETLLRSEIHHLGRRGGIGWGWLRDDGASTTVEEAPPGEAENWRRRALPCSLEQLRLPGHYRAAATIHPPYWDRSQRRVALEYAGDLRGVGASASTAPAVAMGARLP